MSTNNRSVNNGNKSDDSYNFIRVYRIIELVKVPKSAVKDFDHAKTVVKDRDKRGISIDSRALEPIDVFHVKKTFDINTNYTICDDSVVRREGTD